MLETVESRGKTSVPWSPMRHRHLPANQAGVFNLGLDIEHDPCHGGLAVKDVRISKLLDGSRV